MKSPLTKGQKIFRYSVGAIAAIYLISVIERTLLKEDSSTEIMIEHATEKAQMQSKIDLLENKVHDYELQQLKIRSDVSDMSDAELDSTWTAIFD